MGETDLERGKREKDRLGRVTKSGVKEVLKDGPLR